MTAPITIPTAHLAAELETAKALSGAPIAKLAVMPHTSHVTDKVGDVRTSLHGTQHVSVTHIALVHGTRLVGLVRTTAMLAADENMLMGDLAMDHPPVVDIHTSRDGAVWIAVQRGSSEVAVVDDNHNFVGIIPAHQLLAILIREHNNDMARIGGYLHQGDTARETSMQPVISRFAHRLPWLLVGLCGAIVASLLVSRFEENLNAVVSLAFFMPAVIYLAAAVAAQTETVVVRGLSVGVNIRDVAIRDLSTGVLIGVVLGGAFLIPAFLISSSWNIATAVSLAVLCACSTANILALSVPWLFNRLKLDPALGTGPVATIIQDVTSILIYFAVTSTLVDF